MTADGVQQPLLSGGDSAGAIRQKPPDGVKRFRRCRTAPSFDPGAAASEEPRPPSFTPPSNGGQTSPPPKKVLDSGRPSASFRLVGLLLLAYVVAGTTAFYLFMDHMSGLRSGSRLIDALYFCVVTMTTVGYGDLVPSSDAGKLLASAFAFGGVAVVGTSLSKSADYLVEKQESLVFRAVHANGKHPAGELRAMEMNRTWYKLYASAALLAASVASGTVVLWKAEGMRPVDALYCVCATVPPSIAVEEPASATKDDNDEPKCGMTGCLTNMFKPPALGEDYSIMQALVSVEMLVLFVVSVFGIGGTLTAIDNMAQIGQSLGYPPKSINTFVSLISIWNYAGRVGAGYMSEFFVARYRFPRPLALTAVLLFSCVGHLLIAFGVPQSLYAASVILGFCFGAQWPLLFSIISEVFGLKYYSTLFNFGSAASPLGAYVLNVRIAGRMYDAEAARQHGGHAAAVGDKICKGVRCFKHAFLIITGVTLAGVLVSLVLVWRTRNFYKGDIYAKFKVAPVVAPADGSDHHQGGETVKGTVVTAEDQAHNGKNKKLQEVNDEEFK